MSDDQGWGQRAKQKLRDLSLLKDGFCNAGDRAPTPHALTNATKFLDLLIEQNNKPRRIAPDADGGVVFTLASGERVLFSNDACDQ